MNQAILDWLQPATLKTKPSSNSQLANCLLSKFTNSHSLWKKGQTCCLQSYTQCEVIHVCWHRPQALVKPVKTNLQLKCRNVSHRMLMLF